MEFVPSLTRMHQVYLTVAYGYALYTCANNYYNTTKKIIKLGYNGYMVCVCTKNKLRHWVYAPTPPPVKPEKNVELSNVVTSQPSSVIHGDLDDVIVNWFQDDNGTTPTQ